MLLGVDSGLLRPRVQPWLLGALVVLLLVQAVPVWNLGDEWEKDFILGAIGLAFFLILVPVGLALAGQRGMPAPMLGGAAAVGLAAVVVIGWPNSDDYVKDRYQASTAPKDFPVGMKAALAWFNRTNPHDSRIAVVGGRPGFKQYIFYGDDLSNYVQYVAKHGPHGAYLPIASQGAQENRDPRSPQQCREWVTALNDGDYRYAVIGPDQRTQSRPPVEADLDRGRRRQEGGGDRRRLGRRDRRPAQPRRVRHSARCAPPGRSTRRPPVSELRRLRLRRHRARTGRGPDGDGRSPPAAAAAAGLGGSAGTPHRGNPRP